MDCRGFHDLVEHARDGDVEAMGRLLDLVRPQFESLARGHTDPARASQSASDLVQEAEVRVWKGLDGFRGGRDDRETYARFQAWMAAIVEHLGIDLRRRRNASKRKAPGYYLVPLEEVERDASGTAGPRAARAPAAPRPETPSAAFHARERARRVRDAVERIPDPDVRRILEAYHFDGLSLRQVSERLSLPYHRVKEGYREAMRFLEAALADIED